MQYMCARAARKEACRRNLSEQLVQGRHDHEAPPHDGGVVVHQEAHRHAGGTGERVRRDVRSGAGRGGAGRARPAPRVNLCSLAKAKSCHARVSKEHRNSTPQTNLHLGRLSVSGRGSKKSTEARASQTDEIPPDSAAGPHVTAAPTAHCETRPPQWQKGMQSCAVCIFSIKSIYSPRNAVVGQREHAIVWTYKRKRNLMRVFRHG